MTPHWIVCVPTTCALSNTAPPTQRARSNAASAAAGPAAAATHACETASPADIGPRAGPLRPSLPSSASVPSPLPSEDKPEAFISVPQAAEPSNAAPCSATGSAPAGIAACDVASGGATDASVGNERRSRRSPLRVRPQSAPLHAPSPSPSPTAVVDVATAAATAACQSHTQRRVARPAAAAAAATSTGT